MFAMFSLHPNRADTSEKRSLLQEGTWGFLEACLATDRAEFTETDGVGVGWLVRDECQRSFRHCATDSTDRKHVLEKRKAEIELEPFCCSRIWVDI